MSLITWHDDYSINVCQIDFQHQELVELVNQLHDAVKSHSNPQTLDRLMIKLIESTTEHFATEEKLMIENDYPGYTIHKSQHDDLLWQLKDFAREVSGMPSSAFRFSFDISTDWLMKHIVESDVRLGKFLNKKNVF